MIDKHPEESPKIKEVISRFGRQGGQGGQGEEGYTKEAHPEKTTPEALATLAAGAKAEKDSNDWQPNEEEII